jgi:hypothetical protein
MKRRWMLMMLGVVGVTHAQILPSEEQSRREEAIGDIGTAYATLIPTSWSVMRFLLLTLITAHQNGTLEELALKIDPRWKEGKR